MYIYIRRNTVQISITDALKRESKKRIILQTCKYHPDMLLLHSLGTPCKPFLEISQSVPHFLDLGDLKKTLYIVIPVLYKMHQNPYRLSSCKDTEIIMW